MSNSCFIGNIFGETTVKRGHTSHDRLSGATGHISSSRRFKTDIKPIDKASESILALKPVSFHYKVHKNATPQFGLIAEEVAEVNPDLVMTIDGGPYTVRYEAVNAMLLNEFLKEHRRVEALQASFAQQQKDFQATVAQQQKQIEALTAVCRRWAHSLRRANLRRKWSAIVKL